MADVGLLFTVSCFQLPISQTRDTEGNSVSFGASMVIAATGYVRVALGACDSGCGSPTPSYLDVTHPPRGFIRRELCKSGRSEGCTLSFRFLVQKDHCVLPYLSTTLSFQLCLHIHLPPKSNKSFFLDNASFKIAPIMFHVLVSSCHSQTSF